MNTFDMMATLAPLIRYDDRWARALGKYLLNGANSCRLFYANAHDDAHQNSAAWAHRYDRTYCIAYEGCRELGRRSAKAKEDVSTGPGEIVSGDFMATHVIAERPSKRCQVLRESIVGDHDGLQHVWSLDLPTNVRAWLSVEGHWVDGGDADSGFRFSYATEPAGPYKTLFTMRDAKDHDEHYGASLPLGLAGTLYLQVEDTDRTPGQMRPDTLHLDAVYILYELDRSPFAMGDGVGGRPRDKATDLALYGSSHVGYLGGIVQTTNADEILRFDLLKTDWYHAKAYPTYLYFNPHDQERRIDLDVGGDPRDLYDTVSEQFVARDVKGRTSVAIPGDSAAVIVLCPAGARLVNDADRTWIDGVVVDFHHPAVIVDTPSYGAWLRGRVPVKVRAEAPQSLTVRRVTVELDGNEIYNGAAAPGGLVLDTSQYRDGSHVLTVSVEVEGGATDRCSTEVFFDNGRAEYAFPAPTIAGWSRTAGSFAQVELRNGRAVIIASQGPWGAVLSEPFPVDLDRRPALLIEVSAPDPRWVLKVRVDGKDDYYVQPDTAEEGTILLDLAKSVRRRHPTADLTGTRSLQLMIGASGKQGASAAVGSIRMVYQAGR
jgi:hypothetical protein